MKPHLLLALAATVLFTGHTEAQNVPTTYWDDVAETSWYNDIDTLFAITTAEELAGLSVLVAEGNAFAGTYFVIENDLDLGDHLWTPIGVDHTLPFSGLVNGNNHVISNLFINSPDGDFIGLFGKVINGTITNITLENPYIRAMDTAGSLAGSFSTNSNMTNCHATGVDVVAGSYNIGGLAGELTTNSTMHQCSSSGSVTGVNQVGGLVGSPWDLTVISECYTSGTVQAEYLAGGIAGFCTFAFGPNRDNTILNCYSYADIIATTGRAGGIFGGNTGALVIKNTYSTGTATGGELIGGFIGSAGGATIGNSYWDTETSGLNNGVGAGTGLQEILN